MKLTRNEALLIAKLLDIAGDQFGNHGCNDFDLNEVEGADFTLTEMNQLAAYYHAWNGDIDEMAHWSPNQASTYLGDSRLMNMLAAKLRGETPKD